MKRNLKVIPDFLFFLLFAGITASAAKNVSSQSSSSSAKNRFETLKMDLYNPE